MNDVDFGGEGKAGDCSTTGDEKVSIQLRPGLLEIICFLLQAELASQHQQSMINLPVLLSCLCESYGYNVNFAFVKIHTYMISVQDLSHTN